MSSTASSPPFFIWAPKGAFSPVVGPTTATGILASSSPPQPASETAAAIATTRPEIRFIVTMTTPNLLHFPGGTAKRRNNRPLHHVRFWHLADIHAARLNVRL